MNEEEEKKSIKVEPSRISLTRFFHSLTARTPSEPLLLNVKHAINTRNITTMKWTFPVFLNKENSVFQPRDIKKKNFPSRKIKLLRDQTVVWLQTFRRAMHAVVKCLILHIFDIVSMLGVWLFSAPLTTQRQECRFNIGWESFRLHLSFALLSKVATAKFRENRTPAHILIERTL